MVHRRGFSFTDDSAGVTTSLLPVREDGQPNGKQLFAPSLEAAEELSQLRQIQSYAYQKLFQSVRLVFEDAWPLMSSSLHEMHRWSEDSLERLSDHKMKPLRKLFRSDVLYSSILILSPDLVGTLCDYGKFLIFEYAAEYADLMASISGDHERLAFYTYHDALAATFVAKCLISTLCADSAVLFNDIIPQAPWGSIPPLGPSTIPARTVGERVNRAHGCLTQMERTLGYLGPRYGYLEPLNEFKAQSSGIRRMLQTTYENWNRSLGVSRGQYVSSDSSTMNGSRR